MYRALGAAHPFAIQCAEGGYTMTLATAHTPQRRIGRTMRSDHGVQARINERDRWLLDALARMQFLTTRQIARLLFNGSRSATRRRLRKLFDAGVIRAWMRSLNADNVYALTPRGRQLLEEESAE